MDLYAADGRIHARATSCAECSDGWRSSTDAYGYAVSTRCDCHRIPQLARRINAARMPADHLRSVLAESDVKAGMEDYRDAFDPNRAPTGGAALEAAVRFVDAVHAHDFDDVGPMRAPAAGLLLIGAEGRGKTHLVVAVCRRLLSLGHAVEYRSWVEWSRELWSAIGARRDAASRGTVTDITNPDDEVMRAARVPILALDELGAGLAGRHGGTEIERGWVNSILKLRHDAGLPLLLASNYRLDSTDPGGLGVDPTIVSRIYGRCQVVVMAGDDQRRGER